MIVKVDSDVCSGTYLLHVMDGTVVELATQASLASLLGSHIHTPKNTTDLYCMRLPILDCASVVGGS